MRISIIWLLLGFLAVNAGADEYYRWTDKNGVVNYSDHIPHVPITNLQEKKVVANVIDGQPSYAMKVAAEKSPVILFGGDCGPICTNAQAFLDKRGIPYTLKDPQKNKDDAVALNALTGALNLPVLKVGNNALKGFQSDYWTTALDQAGYPKSALPGKPKLQPVSLSK